MIEKNLIINQIYFVILQFKFVIDAVNSMFHFALSIHDRRALHYKPTSAMVALDDGINVEIKRMITILIQVIIKMMRATSKTQNKKENEKDSQNVDWHLEESSIVKCDSLMVAQCDDWNQSGLIIATNKAQ